MNLKAPFPWFGGKSRVAHLVWDRFGNCANYVEPFAGSLAVLLGRPGTPQTETVNDLDCYLANFWRSISVDPESTAEASDWPVNEADLHARHLWLVNQLEFRERMKTDPEYFDARIAGWWVWGISQWIGSGWCSRPDWTGRTNAGRVDRGIHRKRPMVHGGHTGKGVHAANPGVPSQFGPSRKMPHLGGGHGGQGRGITTERVSGNAGQGVNRQLPHLGDAGRGDDPAASAPGGCGVPDNGSGAGVHADRAVALYAYFAALADRLRRVRVCCGDWTRVLGPSVTSQAVRQWAIENGGDPMLRIALCGYEDEHQMPMGWETVHWKAHGGYGSQAGDRGNENAKRERIWFSPHCLRVGLFSHAIESLEVRA